MWNFESFDKSREQEQSLKQIEKQIKNKTKEDLKDLKVDMQVIRNLHSGLKVVDGDTLFEINDITSSEHKINWLTEKKNGKWVWNADEIDIGDTIKIIGKEVYKEPKDWGKKVLIGNVIKGFEMKKEKKAGKSKVISKDKEVVSKEPNDEHLFDEEIYKNHNIKRTGNQSKIKDQYDWFEESVESKISDLGWKKEINQSISTQSTTELASENIEKIESKDIDTLFNSFKDTIKRIDTLLDTQTSSEKISNKDLLDTNYNALIILIKNVEAQKYSSPEIQNKINSIKLYLAKYYADEWSIENSNFTNYQLSNTLAFDVLWNIDWVDPVPKAPEMWDIISSFKWTWIGTYIITKINEWESESNIFSSKVVKDVTKENWEQLINKYEDSLEKHLEFINENKRDWLSQVQKDALDLLLDVNWVGWGNVKNSNVDKFDVMGWDFAAIWAWIGTGFWVGLWLGAWTWAWALVTWSAWAVAWWVVSTLWMMVNHWDNYFWEDWRKWWTELAINTAMFWAWWALFKWARMIQWGSKLLSWRWAMAVWVEATGDVAIWVSTDMTRWWAYEMDIELWDAIVNNLVWALLPITLRWKQGFSEVRKKLAKNVSEWQKKASILAKLWDKPWAKKIIDGLNNEIKRAKKSYDIGLKKVKKLGENSIDFWWKQIEKVKNKIGSKEFVHKDTWVVYIKTPEGKFIKKETWKTSTVKSENLITKKEHANNLDLKKAKAEKKAVKETISDKEFDNFTKNNTVSDKKLNAIADKITSNKGLSLRETAIHQWKTSDIEKIIQKRFQENAGKNIYGIEKTRAIDDNTFKIHRINQQIETTKIAKEHAKKNKKSTKSFDKKIDGLEKRKEILTKENNWLMPKTNAEKISDLENRILMAEENIKTHKQTLRINNVDRSKLPKKLGNNAAQNIKIHMNNEIARLSQLKKDLRRKINKLNKAEKGVKKEAQSENTDKSKANNEVKSRKSLEILWKISEAITKSWKYTYNKLKNGLTPSWKAKLWPESVFLKDFEKNVADKVKGDYQWWKFITGTLKAPVRAAAFWAEQVWTKMLKPAWQVTSAINPLKLHRSMWWKERIVWGLVASSIHEWLTLGKDESIMDKEHLLNIPINGAQLATVWLWTLASEPLVNTVYWKIKWFEPRDFTRSYIDNLWWNIYNWKTPYELWESLTKSDEQILSEMIKNMKAEEYPESMIKEMEKKLKAKQAKTEQQ